MSEIENTTTEKASTPIKKQPINTPFLLSLTLLSIVLATSAFFFVSNQALRSEITIAQKQSADFDTSIAKLKSDPDVISVETLEFNKESIRKNIRDNEAQKYLWELQKIAKTQRVQFSGFSYQAGKISTTVTATPDVLSASGADAITKISSLIATYRSGSGNVFRLAPVSSVSGVEQKRTFSAEFLVNGVAK